MRIIYCILLVFSCFMSGFSQSTNYTFKFGLPANDFIVKMQWADMNNDGRVENIWTDGSTISIMNQRDTSLMSIQSFQAIDLDRNGLRDLVFSGVNNNSKPLTFAWFFGDDFTIINRMKVADLSGQI